MTDRPLFEKTREASCSPEAIAQTLKNIGAAGSDAGAAKASCDAFRAKSSDNLPRPAQDAMNARVGSNPEWVGREVLSLREVTAAANRAAADRLTQSLKDHLPSIETASAVNPKTTPAQAQEARAQGGIGGARDAFKNWGRQLEAAINGAQQK